jgi:hypothetical protein
MASEASDTLPVAPTARKHVVILVHGIRDFAGWQSVIREALKKKGFTVELTNYMRLDLLRFLLPTGFFRRQIIDKVWNQIEYARKRHPDAVFSIIAHSFGTYVVAEILREKFTMQAERVIFCGSVLRYDFPFEQIDGRFKGEIINEVGTADPWPALAESVTTGYGAAGTFGFRRPGVRDRWHNRATHGYFLTAEFCEQFWIPELEGKDEVKGDIKYEPAPLWVQLIWIFKIKYFVSAAAILLLLVLISRAVFGSAYSYSLGQDGAKNFYWNAVVTQMVRDAGAVCPLPRAICSRPGLSRFLTQRRFINVAEFDDELKAIVSCSNFGWQGNDPPAAIEAFASRFPQCVDLRHDEGTNSYSFRARKTGLGTPRESGRPTCDCPNAGGIE